MKSQTLTCHHCNLPFEVSYEEHSGSGSGNFVVKRKYCSNDCKKIACKNSIVNKIKLTCFVCRNDFYVCPSGTGRKYCSRKCKGLNHSKLMTTHDVCDLECATCHQSFKTKNTQRKYCSPKCFSDSNKDGELKNCLICNKEMWIKTSKLAQRFCSRQCQYKAQSNGMIKIRVNGNTGFRSDIENSPYFKSSFEADYARYCIFQKIDYVYQAKTFEVNVRNSICHYTPDFYLPIEDKLIELKGMRVTENKFSQLINSNYEAFLELKNRGENIEIIYMTDFYKSLDELGIYYKILNLEYRNRKGTRKLIKRHED